MIPATILRARYKLHLLTFPSILALIGAALLTPNLLGVRAQSSEQFSALDSWTTYLADTNHDGFNSHETLINVTSAPMLRQKWAHTANNGISDQPIESGGVVYWGSWDGYVHATSVTRNTKLWATFVGRTVDAACDPPSVGVASSPTLGTVNGQAAVLIGGGDASFYALNTTTGRILWKTTLGSPPSHFIWDSPAVSGTSIYIATSSFGDCPLVQSKLFQLDMNSGNILNTFSTVPDGCTGGGVWGSPTIDEPNDTVYITTGNSGSCRTPEANAFALIELHAADLSFVKRHQLSPSERPGDSDFGYTPTLFTATIGGVLHALVGVANKNGKFYAFDRANISANPVWKAQVANGGDCPQCGAGSISPAAWDGTSLYIGGGHTSIGGTACQGSVRRVNPATGAFTWSHCMQGGPVLGSISIAGSSPTGSAVVAAASQGSSVIVMNASTGSTLARLTDLKPGSRLYGGPTISDGILFVGNLDGDLYAYSVNGA